MQKIIPAVRTMKEFEKFLESPYQYGAVLDMHLSMLRPIQRLSEKYGKKMIFHIDLLHGIQSDEYGTEYICQEFKPYGIISTKMNVILTAKKKGVKAVQRLFLIDSQALEKSLDLIKKTRPDFIELLPGAMPWIISEIRETVDIPIMAGGFIRTQEDIDAAIAAGALSITTTNRSLWEDLAPLYAE